jgi:hypothetical protein
MTDAFPVIAIAGKVLRQKPFRRALLTKVTFYGQLCGGRPEARLGDIAPAAVYRMPGNCAPLVR